MAGGLSLDVVRHVSGGEPDLAGGTGRDTDRGNLAPPPCAADALVDGTEPMAGRSCTRQARLHDAHVNLVAAGLVATPCEALIDHHDHKPFWSRMVILGNYIALGGDW